MGLSHDDLHVFCLLLSGNNLNIYFNHNMQINTEYSSYAKWIRTGSVTGWEII
jgi:hypothetical protein